MIACQYDQTGRQMEYATGPCVDPQSQRVNQLYLRQLKENLRTTKSSKKFEQPNNPQSVLWLCELQINCSKVGNVSQNWGNGIIITCHERPYFADHAEGYRRTVIFYGVSPFPIIEIWRVFSRFYLEHSEDFYEARRNNISLTQLYQS